MWIGFVYVAVSHCVAQTSLKLSNLLLLLPVAGITVWATMPSQIISVDGSVFGLSLLEYSIQAFSKHFCSLVWT